MRIRIFVNIVVVSALLWVAATSVAGEACRMQPPCLVFAVQDMGTTWKAFGSIAGTCDTIASGVGARQSGDVFDVVVLADGPGGSGRFWSISVGIVEHEEVRPESGFCLETTTAGWRTLREFGDGPLPWTGDQDADGWPELILWDSFPLYPYDQMTSVGYGLFAWVYEVNEQREFVISWDMTREMARKLSSAYRTAHFAGGQASRNFAADYIDAFINEQCEVDSGSAH